MLRVAGLFAGIGGFEIGFQEEGCSAVLLCENNKYAAAVLKRRFSDVEYHDDVATLKSLPHDIDVVSAGFPCQNLSMAGDKLGLNGKKSSIVNEMFRLLKVRRVPYVLIENVYFMLYLNKGLSMFDIIKKLEELKYNWAYRVVDSRGFGLAQRRRRVFIFASTAEDPRNILLADDSPSCSWPIPTLSEPIGFYWTEGKSGHGLTGNAIPPLKAGSGLGIPSAPAVLLPNGRVVGLPISTAERLQGFQAGWTDNLERDGMGRYRWNLVGNAVSVPVAKWLARRLQNPGTYQSKNDKPMDPARPWPKAAWYLGKDRYAADVSEYPEQHPLGKISSFNTESWPNLSCKALSGFVKRAKEGRLRYPDGFLDALDREILNRCSNDEYA